MKMETVAVPKCLTAFHLKLIALATMIIDHAAAAIPLIPRTLNTLMRGVGRIAFPIYAFLIAEGCRHTRSRERYLLRLGLLALVSEIPFDLAFYNWGISFLNSTNIFYTLFFAVACIHIYETLRSRPRKFLLLGPACFLAFALVFAGMYLFTQSGFPFLILCLLYVAAMLGLCALLSRKIPALEEQPDWRASVLALLPSLPVLFLAEIINCDYSWFGVVLIVLLYVAKTRPAQIGVLVLGVLYEYGWSGGMQLEAVVRWGQTLSPDGWLSLVFALLAVVLMCFYSGERGRNIKWPFYWAYPAHIAILAALKAVLPI